MEIYQDALELSEYARFQQCTATPADIIHGWSVCKVNPPAVGPVNGAGVTSSILRLGIILLNSRKLKSNITLWIRIDLFQVRANPTGGSYIEW